MEDLPDDPFENTQFEDLDHLQSWLEQGGRAHLNEQRARRRAERRRKIAQGDITFGELVATLRRRAERLKSFVEIDAHCTLKESTMNLLLRSLQDAIYSHQENTNPNYEPSTHPHE